MRLASPIRVSSNGRYFVDAEGKPWFWLGDTAWPLYTQYSRAEAEQYLADRAQKGFTVIQGVLAWGGGTGFEGKTPGPNDAGEVPWIDGDPARPNEAYFRHVDHLLKVAESHGLVLAMLPTWGYYVNDAHTLNTENAYQYGKWLGERYKSQPNVIWVSGGDRNPTGYVEVYRALGRGLRAGDGGAHLITYHPCGWTHSSQWFHADDWLDFNMIETWTEWDKVYPAVSYDAQLLPHKPVVLGEGAYEEWLEHPEEYPHGPITPLIVRRQAWWAYLAGGYSTYGHNQLWRMEPGWTKSFDASTAKHMSIYKTIATSRDWWKRVPDQGLFASGVGSEQMLNAAARSPEGDWAMVYLSSQCHVVLYLDKIQASRVHVTLINPATGEQKDAGIYKTGMRYNAPPPQPGLQWFHTPNYWEDAVLLLDAIVE
jgi:hypothetical protein